MVWGNNYFLLMVCWLAERRKSSPSLREKEQFDHLSPDSRKAEAGRLEQPCLLRFGPDKGTLQRPSVSHFTEVFSDQAKTTLLRCLLLA